MICVWLLFSSIITLIIYMILGLPFAIWFYFISSFPDYTGRISFHFEAYIVIWVIFAIVFACMIHFRNSPYRIASLNLYKANKPGFFKDLINVYLTQRRNILAIILTTALYYFLHIVLLLINAPEPVQSFLGFAMFPFTGILLLNMKIFSYILLPKILGLFLINTMTICIAYLISVVIMRQIWHKRHLKMSKAKES